VDVRIGVTYSPRELDIELAAEVDRDDLKARIEKALSDDEGVLWLTDNHGREFAVPSSKVAYIEIGSPDHERRIGFATT
jgi:hypothetical protein